MKKKLTLAIAAYVLLVAGILTYIYCPRTVIKNTAMWYEKDFTIPIFCKTVEFKQLYDLGLYNGKFEVSKDQAEKIVKQLDDALERFENSMKQSEEGLSYKELEIKKNTTNVSKYVYSDETKSITTSAAWNLGENIEVLGYYYTKPQRWETNCGYEDKKRPTRSVFQDGNAIEGQAPACNMIVYKDTNNKYYFRICRYVRGDWCKPQDW